MKHILVPFLLMAFAFLAACEQKQNIVIQNLTPADLASKTQPNTSPSAEPTANNPMKATPSTPPNQEEAKPPVSQSNPYKSLSVDKNYYLVKPFDTAQVILSAELADESTAVPIAGTKAEWTAPDPAIARISNTGLITAWSVGTTIMTVKLGELSKEFTVTVSNSAGSVPENSSYIALGLDKNKYELKASTSLQVSLFATLPNSDVAQINSSKAEWSSLDSAIASISASGLITGQSAGTTSMTVKFGGLSKTFLVTVTP
jgi:hypothetical protein